MQLIKKLLSVQYFFSKQGKNINLFTTIAGKLLGTVVFISDIGAVTVVVTRTVFVAVTVSDSRNVCNSLSRGNKVCQTRVFTMLLPRSIGVNCKRPLSIVFGCWWCYCCWVTEWAVLKLRYRGLLCWGQLCREVRVWEVRVYDNDGGIMLDCVLRACATIVCDWISVVLLDWVCTCGTIGLGLRWKMCRGDCCGGKKCEVGIREWSGG